jgi:hypothetical protein
VCYGSDIHLPSGGIVKNLVLGIIEWVAYHIIVGLVDLAIIVWKVTRMETYSSREASRKDRDLETQVRSTLRRHLG